MQGNMEIKSKYVVGLCNQTWNCFSIYNVELRILLQSKFKDWSIWWTNSRPKLVIIEMLTALYDFDKFIEMIIKIWDRDEILDNLSWSICIALPKEIGANKCKLHMTISLMNHINKLIFRILINTDRKWIRMQYNIKYMVLFKTL